VCARKTPASQLRSSAAKKTENSKKNENENNQKLPGQQLVEAALREEESKKGKVFPYSLPSVGPGADPGVQAVSPQVTK